MLDDSTFANANTNGKIFDLELGKTLGKSIADALKSIGEADDPNAPLIEGAGEVF